jgi:signal transduction histidine kinase
VEITGESAAQRDASKSALAASPPPDKRAVHQERGEGIGLAIVKRLSELLDATVEMTSEPGQGTIVRIVLPRHYPSAQQKP